MSTSVEIASALADSDQLEGLLASLIEVGLSSIGEKSAGELLEEAGITDTWRTEVEQQVNTIASAFVQTEPFRAWLEDILTE